MFIEETEWIRDTLDKMEQIEGKDILDIGSSSSDFRTNVQPHISKNLHEPLVARGCTITYADIKDDVGVDLVVDLSKEHLPQEIFEKKYDLILCCNILEHVVDRHLFMQNLVRFTKKDGLILFTVPYRYPKHNDPIDTMFRPDPQELLGLVSGHIKCDVKKGEVVTMGGMQYYIRHPGRILDYITLSPYWHIWRYYIKPFRWKVTCVLVEVRAISPGVGVCQ